MEGCCPGYARFGKLKQRCESLYVSLYHRESVQYRFSLDLAAERVLRVELHSEAVSRFGYTMGYLSSELVNGLHGLWADRCVQDMEKVVSQWIALCHSS